MKLRIKIRWIVLGILGLILFGIGLYAISILPRKDRISVEELPTSYIIENTDNYVDYQGGMDCSGYATAYVMRHLGLKASGVQLYKEFSRFFDSVAMHNIVDTLKDHGVESKMYYGSIDTLKAELNQGIPVIALIKIFYENEWGKHYVAVIGYDEEYIYLADSTRGNRNIFDNDMYNRKLTYSEFEDLWNTDSYPVKNVYIVAE